MTFSLIYFIIYSCTPTFCYCRVLYPYFYCPHLCTPLVPYDKVAHAAAEDKNIPLLGETIRVPEIYMDAFLFCTRMWDIMFFINNMLTIMQYYTVYGYCYMVGIYINRQRAHNFYLFQS